jgi:hypothetical protein
VKHDLFSKQTNFKKSNVLNFPFLFIWCRALSCPSQNGNYDTPKMATITLTWMKDTPKKVSLGGFDKCHATYTNQCPHVFIFGAQGLVKVFAH